MCKVLMRRAAAPAARSRPCIPRLVQPTAPSAARVRYGRPEMLERAIDRRRREEGRPPASPAPPSHAADPVLALQRAAGNRAVAELLARAPAEKGATGSVQIRGIGAI